MRILYAIAVLFLCSAPAYAWEAPDFPKAKILAVEVYADWCPNCKILDPELAKARADESLKNAPVLFVTLDYTDKQRVYQSKLLGQALGLEDFMKANGAGTGYVAVLDAQTHEELARINRNDDAAAIVSILQKQLAE